LASVIFLQVVHLDDIKMENYKTFKSHLLFKCI